MTPHVTAETNLRHAVQAAIHAPSIHNTQPWAFQLRDDTIDVYADRTRQLTVVDPTGRALRVSCGAAILNLRLALAHEGLSSRTFLLPEPRNPDLLAKVTAGPHPTVTPQEEELFAAIERRHSNRQPFLDTAIPADVRDHLIAAARVEGAWLDVIVGPSAQAMVGELVRTADEILNRDPMYRAELAGWIRDTDEPDGVPRRAAGPAPAPQDLLTPRNFGGPPRTPGSAFEPDPFIAVLGGFGDTPRDDLTAGQALERVLLTATSLGLVASLISQPIDVPRIREQLRLGLRRSGPPQMVLRAGYGVHGRSPARRPLGDVVVDERRSAPTGGGL